MLNRVSIYWVILITLAITSALPVVVIAVLEVQATGDELEDEAFATFVEDARSQAAVYDEQLANFRVITQLISSSTRDLLTADVTVGEVDERYGFGDDGRFGMDEWYEETYYPLHGDRRVSNVLLPLGTTTLSEEDAFFITATDPLNVTLNAVWDAVDTSNLGTSNLAVVSPQGVLRIYPYMPVEAAPRLAFEEMAQIVDVETLFTPGATWWSPPLIDPNDDVHYVMNVAGAIGGDQVVAGVVHELNLAHLRQQLATMTVGESGTALVMSFDDQAPLPSLGNLIVVDPAHDPMLAWNELSREQKRQYWEQFVSFSDPSAAGPQWFRQNLFQPVETYHPGLDVSRMQDETSGSFRAEINDQDMAVAFSRIDETGWYLVMMQPEEELLDTAAAVSERVQRGALVMLAAVFVLSVWLARRITSPVQKLSSAAKKIEDSVDEEADLSQLAGMTTVNGAREIKQLSTSLDEMVAALHQRMRELDSIYAMAQTITTNIDYDATLQAILAAVKGVVDYHAAEIVIRHGATYQVEAWAGSGVFQDTTGHVYRPAADKIGGIIDANEVLFMPDMPVEMEVAMEKGDAEVRSLLVVPLALDDKVMGGIVLVHDESNAFTDAARRQLVKLAAQVSIAIDNAVKVKEREAQLKQQIAELRVEIDQSKREAQTAEITESDFFQNLQSRAGELRRRASSRKQSTEEEENDSE